MYTERLQTLVTPRNRRVGNESFLYNVMCDVARKGERVWRMYF